MAIWYSLSANMIWYSTSRYTLPLYTVRAPIATCAASASEEERCAGTSKPKNLTGDHRGESQAKKEEKKPEENK